MFFLFLKIIKPHSLILIQKNWNEVWEVLEKTVVIKADGE